MRQVLERQKALHCDKLFLKFGRHLAGGVEGDGGGGGEIFVRLYHSRTISLYIDIIPPALLNSSLSFYGYERVCHTNFFLQELFENL